MKLHYNSPVVLTFTLLSIIVLSLNPMTQGQLIPSFFTVYPDAPWANTLTWVQILAHILGHTDWNHALANFAIILLIGPMLEEKYGSGRLLMMILSTAIVTGVLVNLFFETGLLGASGVAFMMILLASFANAKTGHIPLTFILVTALYLGREFFAAFDQDQISQLAHLIGGVIGCFFGFTFKAPDKATGKTSQANTTTQQANADKESDNAGKDDLLSDTIKKSRAQKKGPKEPFDPFKPLKFS